MTVGDGPDRDVAPPAAVLCRARAGARGAAMVGHMRNRQHPAGVERQLALSMLVVLAVVVAAVRAGRALGRCIVFRLARAVPGCVPAWSADRAPPGVPFPARPSTALP